MSIVDTLVELVPFVVLPLIPIILANVATFFIVKTIRSKIVRLALFGVALIGTLVGFPFLILPLFQSDSAHDSSAGFAFIFFLIFCIPAILWSYVVAMVAYLNLAKKKRLRFVYKPTIISIAILLAIGIFFFLENLLSSIFS